MSSSRNSVSQPSAPAEGSLLKWVGLGVVGGAAVAAVYLYNRSLQRSWPSESGRYSGAALTRMETLMRVEIANDAGIEKVEAQKIFANVFAGRKGSKLRRADFERVFANVGVTDDRVVESTFRAFDHDCSGAIDYGEFVHVLATMRNGSKREKLDFLFDAYDLNGDGFLTMEELSSSFAAAAKMTGSSEDNAVRSATELMRIMDTNRDGAISREEFVKAATTGLNAELFDNIQLDPALVDGLKRRAAMRADA